MSHTMTAFPKPSFRTPWRVGDGVIGKGNAGWTTTKSRYICPRQNCSQRFPAEKTVRGSLLNCPSCPPSDPISQGTELNYFDALLQSNFFIKLTGSYTPLLNGTGSWDQCTGFCQFQAAANLQHKCQLSGHVLFQIFITDDLILFYFIFKYFINHSS